MKIKYNMIKRAQKGDIEAIDYVINLCGPLIHYVVAKSLSKKQEIKDCSQYVLERLVRKLDLYNPKHTKFTTWFYIVIRNSIKNYMRDYMKDEDLVDLDHEEVYNYVEYDREQEFMENMLCDIEEHIGSELYEILLLRIGYQMTYFEISEIVNKPYHKVKRDFNNAYKLAKDYLEYKK